MQVVTALWTATVGFVIEEQLKSEPIFWLVSIFGGLIL